MGTTVRQAGPIDVPVIRDIALRTWPEAYGSILAEAQLHYMLELMYSSNALVEQMTQRQHRFLLALQGTEPVGFSAMEHGHGGMDRTRLHKLYLLPNAQGTGAGSLLLQAVLSAAREVGDGVVELNVNRFNKALHWYLHRGFNVVRDEVIDIGRGYVMDDHVLERTIQQDQWA